MDDVSQNRATAPAVLRRLFALIWTNAANQIRLITLATFLLLVAISILNVAVPFFFKAIIDSLGAFEKSPAPVLLSLLVAGYLGSQWVAKICAELRGWAYGRFEQRIQRQLALDFFDHIHTLPLRFHLDRRTGALQQVVIDGMHGYSLIFYYLMFVILPLGFEVALVSATLAKFYDWQFLCIFLATSALYVITSIVGVTRQQQPQRIANKTNVDAFAKATDSYLNYETVKYFNAETKIHDEVEQILRRGEHGWAQYYFTRTAVGLLQSLWLMVGLTLTVVLAIRDITAGTMTIGDFTLVTAYIQQLIRPLESLGVAYREVKAGFTSVENLHGLMAEPRETGDGSHAGPLRPGPGTIAFHAVCFSYNDGKPTLNDVTLSIPGGSVTAVVGPSGAGKSTLTKLLFRFYDATAGRIAIDGQDLQDIERASLRSAIAVVPQDIALFNDTLAYNIGIGRQGSSLQEIQHAARVAEMHDFIASLPDGYDTIVGERGLKLSGGQRQRIAIARAVLKQARIYIFDEATSALDHETEQRIQANLQTALRGRTIILIAHRPSSIAHAEKIFILSDGDIVEYDRNEGLAAWSDFEAVAEDHPAPL